MAGAELLKMYDVVFLISFIEHIRSLRFLTANSSKVPRLLTSYLFPISLGSQLSTSFQVETVRQLILITFSREIWSTNLSIITISCIDMLSIQ